MMRAIDLRTVTLLGGLAVIVALIFAWLGNAYGVRMLVEASCLAIVALGLNVQWGYAGLFNAGVMGFIAIAAFTGMLVSFPVNPVFWESEAPVMLLRTGTYLIIGVAVTYLVSRADRIGVPKKLRTALTVVVAAVTYLTVQNALAPAAEIIEKGSSFVGGFGLPVGLGWVLGGLVAGLLAWFIGRITLGLRSDYLAIATLGIAEIVKSFLKNADWLTRGTLTVSPLPWPVPTPNEIGFVAARSAYLALTAVLIVAIYILLQRGWASPWGRMMRAIRDNETAAEAVGKDVNRRRLEMFVLGNIIVGVGGAALVTFGGIFDPSGFNPINHTFLVLIMVVLGGSGNNLGTIFGALLVYVIWTMSEPAALILFRYGASWFQQIFDIAPPSDLPTRALQMRVFVIGLTIILVLRFAPRGLLPEKVMKYE
ncbi:branched-chain amino acid ABC transporter permease [Allomesorhizobium camelthorni]|uniref:Branched-chain amino acid ABC transporter permease n=1 Tax=Allomesorhizobium camelthorni TaxID=475069 RepID=A0A6G4WGN8_9HYPH|nr:branched-chain amino acid ABC transporter permease [Mesorhizobium camelthorni]NGO53290.1 branched-chain amino acid ABC transporter permease [Mesorhizobium camelthorni]